LSATPQLRALIRHKSSAADYQALGITEGMRTLKQDGIVKILMGMTDLAQVHCACA
jgi:type II secretory ATPase GspE/PulE/Tfp pilus assembly ATPase PilB-like protein